MDNKWTISSSKTAKETTNPIREIVDKLDLKNLPKGKPLIPLSIGDPSKFGNLPVPKIAIKAVVEALESGDANGYQPSFGNQPAREAIAKRYNERFHTSYEPKDIYLGSGCSDAINISMCALLDRGDNILLPKPGFSLYSTICGRYGFVPKFYNLDPKTQWQVDVEHLRSQIDENTKAILINNPSNPCGSVFPREHLAEICKVAYEHRLPILADEIYADMVFAGEEFVSCAEVTTGPVMVLGGLAKQYLAPGWRVGWVVFHDPDNRMCEVRQGMLSMTQVILGANSLVQAALPTILEKIPKSYYKSLNRTLSIAANIMYKGFNKIPSLRPVKPQGAMYLMVEILIDRLEGITDDVHFCQLLLKEEAVMCLPGTIFGSPNFFRVVICPPPEQLRRALRRIENFCEQRSLTKESGI
jgi:tyrosine aminotransferase